MGRTIIVCRSPQELKAKTEAARIRREAGLGEAVLEGFGQAAGIYEVNLGRPRALLVNCCHCGAPGQRLKCAYCGSAL